MQLLTRSKVALIGLSVAVMSSAPAMAAIDVSTEATAFQTDFLEVGPYHTAIAAVIFGGRNLATKHKD